MRDVKNLKAKDYNVNLSKELVFSKLSVLKFVLYHIVIFLINWGLWEITKLFSTKCDSFIYFIVASSCFILFLSVAFLFICIEVIYIFCFFSEWFNIIKIPLMKLSCRRVKVLINNLENFKTGVVNISGIKAYQHEYYGVKTFYGYVMNESIAFKPNFVGFFCLFCEDMFCDTLEFLNKIFIIPIYGNTKNRKEKKIKINDNIIISIDALNKEIVKMQKQTNVYFQQAKEELDKVGN